MKQKRDILLAFSAIVYSITLIFVMISNFTARSQEHWRFFYAFTQQSNILVLIWLLLFAFGVFKPTKLNHFIRNKVTITSLAVYISITYFIVALVLDPVYKGTFHPVKSSSELWLHHLTPVVMWFYYFLVKGTGEASIKKSLLSLVYPILYFGTNLIIGAVANYADGSPAYAYGFTNPANYSNYFIFILFILALIAVFAVFTVGLAKFKTYIDTHYHDAK